VPNTGNSKAQKPPKQSKQLPRQGYTTGATTYQPHSHDRQFCAFVKSAPLSDRELSTTAAKQHSLDKRDSFSRIVAGETESTCCAQYAHANVEWIPGACIGPPTVSVNEEASLSLLTDLYEQIRSCPKCVLAQSRALAVPGEGPENSEIMFIGEAPGYHENRLGRPFVGAAGKFLEELLASIHMRREDVYICNVIKCRPPNNREPLPSEIEACRPYLDLQIELIRPRLIVTLGRYSMAKFFPKASISKIHGKSARFGDLLVLPLFHPAAALHQPKYRSDIEQDVLRIPHILAQADGVTEGQLDQPLEQMSLF
jgi:uracil-DNA glycosylase family 4